MDWQKKLTTYDLSEKVAIRHARLTWTVNGNSEKITSRGGKDILAYAGWAQDLISISRYFGVPETHYEPNDGTDRRLLSEDDVGLFLLLGGGIQERVGCLNSKFSDFIGKELGHTIGNVVLVAIKLA